MRTITHFALWNLGLASSETQTTEAERDCLARRASGKKLLAEIGVWHGVTTCRLRRAMAPEATLLAVDPYPVGRLGFSMQRIIAQREVGKISNGSVEWIRETSGLAASTNAFARSSQFDFVFIDGDHSYEGLKLDWQVWSSLLLPAVGIISLHDSRSTPCRPIDGAGSVQFTRDVVLRDTRFEVVEEVDSLTVLRRR